jgi:hypothetical protein
MTVTGFYCKTHSSPWYSSMFCGQTNEWLESDVKGFAVSLANAYPVTDSITVGVEHKTRSFSFDGYGGRSGQTGFSLNCIFVDMAFR